MARVRFLMTLPPDVFDALEAARGEEARIAWVEERIRGGLSISAPSTAPVVIPERVPPPKRSTPSPPLLEEREVRVVSSGTSSLPPFRCPRCTRWAGCGGPTVRCPYCNGRVVPR
jgi:hypothetical protein